MKKLQDPLSFIGICVQSLCHLFVIKILKTMLVNFLISLFFKENEMPSIAGEIYIVIGVNCSMIIHFIFEMLHFL